MSKITSTNYDLTSLTLKLHKMSKKKNLHCISRAWHVLFRFLWNNIIFNNTVYQYLLETQLERPFAKRIISKSWYRHRHQDPHRHRKKKTVLYSAAFMFVFRSYLWSETSMVSSFSTALAGLAERFSSCLEQLFCRETVRACLWRKELHSRRYLRSCKNTELKAAACRFVNLWWRASLQITSWKFL